jgi:hypothetical protein
VGDVDLQRRTVYIDKGIKPEYREGIALHELVEREGLRKGLTNAESHARANLAEYQLYRRRWGAARARRFLLDEEIDACLHARKAKGRFPKRSRPNGAFLYGGRRWQLRPWIEERVGIDLLPRSRVLLVNPRVPPRHREAISVYVITERQVSERGIRYTEADRRGWQAARAFLKEQGLPPSRLREARAWQQEFYHWGLGRHKRSMLGSSPAQGLRIITSIEGRGRSA